MILSCSMAKMADKKKNNTPNLKLNFVAALFLLLLIVVCIILNREQFSTTVMAYRITLITFVGGFIVFLICLILYLIKKIWIDKRKD